MPELTRVGIAIDAELLEQFDQQIARRGYKNRSEAVRDLMRDSLIRERVSAANAKVVGTLTLVYDHHVRQLADRLNDFQHEHHHEIVSTLHVHLDHDNCMEVIVLRGKCRSVQQIADGLISLKGIRHGQLVLTEADGH
jgi:CopG family nickel-responsive transcriptional regulator